MLLVILKHLRWRVQLKQIRLVKLLTSSNPSLRNTSGNKVDNVNDLKHSEQLNDSFISQISNNLESPMIIKNSKKHSISSKTLDLFRVRVAYLKE